MEILFVSHKYPPSVGGMEKQSFELINGMKRYAKVHTIVFDGKANRLRFFLSLNKRILRLCREHPDIRVIHFNDGLLAAFCLLHRGYRHLKLTVTLHGLDVVFPVKIYQKYVITKFNRFHRIFAVSRATAAACVAAGISAEKITVINNGVDDGLSGIKPQSDFSKFCYSKYGLCLNNKVILVAMGRAVKRKGFSWFIQNVVPRLSGEFLFLIIGPYSPKATFASLVLQGLPGSLRQKTELFLGYPSDERNIQKLLLKPQISSKVRHLGRLPLQELVRVLAASNAFVMPNIQVAGDMEGFGLVCLEASLCGTVVFAAASGGITDAIRDGKNGFLLPSGDAEAWIAALNALIADPGFYKQKAAGFKQYSFAHFSWDKMVTEYLHEFRKIAGT